MRILLFSWLLLFCLSVFFSIDRISVYSQCLEDQSSLLLQLKQSFHHPSAYVPEKLLSWNSSTDCCSWEGITYDGDAGHVIGLDLSSQSLSGEVNDSNSLFNLTYLEYLNLADNYNLHFNTTRFDQLISLTYLNLSCSGLRRQIPIEISRLTRLVSLDLSENRPDEPLELGTLVRSLTDLITLRLDRTNLSAQGSEWCQVLSSALPNLQVLSISLPSFGPYRFFSF